MVGIPACCPCPPSVVVNKECICLLVILVPCPSWRVVIQPMPGLVIVATGSVIIVPTRLIVNKPPFRPEIALMPLSTATRSNLPSSLTFIIMGRSGLRSRSWLWIRGSLHVRLRNGHWLPCVQGMLGVGVISILLLLVGLLVVAAFGFPLLGIGNPERGGLVRYRLAVEALQNNNGIGDVEEVAKGESSRFE